MVEVERHPSTGEGCLLSRVEKSFYLVYLSCFLSVFWTPPVDISSGFRVFGRPVCRAVGKAVEPAGDTDVAYSRKSGGIMFSFSGFTVVAGISWPLTPRFPIYISPAFL